MIEAVATIFLAAGDKDVPAYILLPLAFIIPLGVLLGFSFLTRRRGGGH